jgi:hypothetical protein
MLAMNYEDSYIFSGLLAYSYTLLISSFYILLVMLDVRLLEEKGMPIILILSTIGWVIILIILFILYPRIPNEPINKWFSGHPGVNFFIIVAITIILSFFLNKSSLESYINRRYGKQRIEKSRKTEDKVKDFKSKLTGENNP